MDMKEYAKAEENFLLATQIFSKFKESDGLVNEDGAKAFFFLAEIYRMRFDEIKITGKTQKDIEAAAKRKGDEFKKVAETYMSAAALVVAEWTIRSVYSIGIAAKTYAADFRNQTLIGKEDVKLATQIQILSNFVHQFYEEALGNFVKAIQLARESGIKAGYVREAELYLSQTWFLKGYAFEEAGNILRNSPIPKGLDEEEEMAYIDALEEYYVNFVQQALPVYVAGINNMTTLFVGKNVWSDTIQSHIGLLAAGLGASGFDIGEIAEATTDLDAEVAKARADGRFVEVSAADVARKQAEADHEQALTAINNVLMGSMSVGDKLSALASRRANAERAKMDEEQKIVALRMKLGL
jgi:tetratricopeptide (TPR) repeat protein